ncbi:tannase and feruloyl esterase [Venturia nashicola]|uniref:Tannase and feruloyl esterase n=1 Tax=Venturia nashicola TaxID=86259 RepID=A0A4Z1NQL7_9PEZI|nr:tannase and feruloyl esterase [Venturia nashicola]
MHFQKPIVLLALPITVSPLSSTTLLHHTSIAETSSYTTSANPVFQTDKTYCNVSATIENRIQTWFQLPTPEAWNGRYV